MPTFLEAQQQDNYFLEVEDNFKEYAREYATLSVGFRRQVTLDQYCGIKYRGRTRSYHRGSNELERRAGKMEIPTFDGSAKTIVQAWVQKLDAYLQLNPVRELDVVKFSIIYLEGKAHDWWYHGMNTLGHNHIKSYPKFTQRLNDKFDQGDPELHFRELTQLRQTGSPETFIEEFHRMAVIDGTPMRLG